MIRKAACLLAVGLILAPVAAMAQNAAREKAAAAAAEKWLGLVDQGKYAESWKEAATDFREHVTEQQWEHSVSQVRKSLGKLLSRHLKTSAYKTSLPGAPAGQYVLMEFDASYANKKTAVETVTTVLDKGTWRVVGYYIR